MKVREIVNFEGKSLLCMEDLSSEDLLGLIRLAEILKMRRRNNIRGKLLEYKVIALLLEKASTRTRCAFSSSMAEEGGCCEILLSDEIHLGKKESIEDTARVLGRMFDGIAFRGYSQDTLEVLAKYSGVPVWNALTDTCHPTQILADFLTIKERFGQLKNLKIVYIGDGRNNVACSLMIGCAILGLEYVDCTPVELFPDEELIKKAEIIASKGGGRIKITADIEDALKGANVVYTDVWVSMGEEEKFRERILLLKSFQVDMEKIRATGNLEKNSIIFMHCLPAFHNNKTEFTSTTGALEVTDDVFYSSFSVVFDQAENRKHTIKALLVGSLSADADINL